MGGLYPRVPARGCSAWGGRWCVPRVARNPPLPDETDTSCIVGHRCPGPAILRSACGGGEDYQPFGGFFTNFLTASHWSASATMFRWPLCVRRDHGKFTWRICEETSHERSLRRGGCGRRPEYWLRP